MAHPARLIGGASGHSRHLRRGRHPWATFMPLSVACECRATPLGDVLATIRCLRVPPCALGRHSCPYLSPKSAALRPWATFSPLFVASECGLAPLGDESAPICRLRVEPCALGRRFRPYLSPQSAALRPWATFSPLFVASECGPAPLGDILPDFGPIALTDKYFCGLMDFA